MKSFISLCLCLVTSAVLFAQSNTDREAILKVMHQQATDWNNGDLDHFMESYWKNDSLAFVGSKAVVYGWNATLENYKKQYPGKAAMGELSFSDIKVELLSPTSAFVIGAWHLKREIGDIGGHYTLLFKKLDGHWLITVDHSS